MSAASMAALNTSFAGQRLNKAAARKVSAKVTTRAVKPVTRAQAVAAPADVSSETVMDCVNTIRFLAIDAINKSNSGHPGLPMGCAPMGYVIYREAMTHNPKNYQWFNRDRFVLSAGHGCMLQYSLMHLTGYPSVSVSHRTLSFCRTRAAYPIGRAHSPGKTNRYLSLCLAGRSASGLFDTSGFIRSVRVTRASDPGRLGHIRTMGGIPRHNGLRTSAPSVAPAQLARLR